MTPPAASGGPGRFKPQAVPLGEWAEIMREAASLLSAAPLRLTGLFLLVFMPIQLVPNLPYVAMPLRETIAAIGFTGFFLALESVRNGEPPTLLDMAAAWRLPVGKLLLLAASGLIPILFVAVVWWVDVGGSALDDLLSGRIAASAISEREQLEFVLGYNLAGMPFFFLQPLCILAPWSASRTMAANLLACLANWRWVLVLTVLLVPIAIGTGAFDADNAVEQVLSLLSEVAVGIVLSAFTLRLLQRSLGTRG